MPKKRRSLQSILVPPFFYPALSSEASASPPPPSPRHRSHSAAASTSQFVLPPAIPIVPSPALPSSSSVPRNSPPSDLLDDDPFANLSPAPSTLYAGEDVSHDRPPTLATLDIDSAVPPPRVNPRSPLSQSFDVSPDEEDDGDRILPWQRSPVTPPSTPLQRRPATLRRPKSSGNGQARPAYTRPAFSSRPSLPSLNTLAELNVVIPRVKRGRVGATLPAEPWSITDSSVFEQPLSPRPSLSRRPSLSTIRDSRILDSDASLQAFEDDSDAQDSGDSDSSSTTSVPDRSATPRASDSTFGPRSTSPIDSYLSTYIPPGYFDTHASSSTEDTCSSPEPSFPPTPQLSANSPPFSNRGYSALFSHRTRDTVFDDLSSTLEYDYSHAITRLEPPPPPREPALGFADDGCEFEPGTSAQTIRRLAHAPSTSTFRSSSSESRADDAFSPMAPYPLSPTTLSSVDGQSSGTSSSDFDDAGDFLTTYSDSSDEDFLTAPLSRASSPVEPLRLDDTPAPSLPHDDDAHEASESSGADIAARLSRLSAFSQSDVGSSRYVSAQEYVDSADDGRRSRGQGRQGEGESSRQSGRSGYAGYSGYGQGAAPSGGGAGGGSGGGRRDRDGDDDKYRRPVPRQSAPAYSDSDTSEDEESDGEDETPRRAKARQPPLADSSSADDDVPLAQQIPTALRAQRTIRRQVRDEAVERRRAKSLRRPQTSERSRPSMSPQPPLQEPPAPPPPAQASRTPSVVRTSGLPENPKPIGRPRTKTLPSQIGSPFSMGELTKKLLGVQAPAPPLPATQPRASQDPPTLSPKLPSSRIPSQIEQQAALTRPPAQDSTTLQRLRSMRSFHRPRTTGGDELPPPVPSGGAQLGRSATSASRRHHHHPESLPPPALAQQQQLSSREGGRSSLERARSTRSQSRRPSVDRERSARPSLDQDARPPMPPLPPPAPAVKQHMTAWQQRFFIGSLQRFEQIEITSSSTARDVLGILQNRGKLDGSASGWMIWEVSQDFGMERPIRSFEVLGDVCNSWVADKTVNVLMAKKTPLAAKLSRSAIPSSSPICGGFVQHEYKRGKWQKRWLELREHSLWLSKRDSGKDQIQLCSLSNFDAYIVTRVTKAPKSYVFAVKSTDNLSFFESTSDYVHVFSCDQKDGENWLEKILLARSYVLYQERNVLTTTAAPISIAGASLSRSGTRKRPVQPLVNFGAAAASVPTEPPAAAPPPVFEPGSLLVKRV